MAVTIQTSGEPLLRPSPQAPETREEQLAWLCRKIRAYAGAFGMELVNIDDLIIMGVALDKMMAEIEQRLYAADEDRVALADARLEQQRLSDSREQHSVARFRAESTLAVQRHELAELRKVVDDQRRRGTSIAAVCDAERAIVLR